MIQGTVTDGSESVNTWRHAMRTSTVYVQYQCQFGLMFIPETAKGYETVISKLIVLHMAEPSLQSGCTCSLLIKSPNAVDELTSF